jgi:hypothetical protein
MSTVLLQVLGTLGSDTVTGKQPTGALSRRLPPTNGAAHTKQPAALRFYAKACDYCTRKAVLTPQLRTSSSFPEPDLRSRYPRSVPGRPRADELSASSGFASAAS